MNKDENSGYKQFDKPVEVSQDSNTSTISTAKTLINTSSSKE